MPSTRRSHSRAFRRLLTNIFLVVLGLIALALIVGLILPGRYRVQRSVEIQAKPDVIYPDLATVKNWPEWTVWNTQLDPTMQITYTGPESGVGAGYAWTGQKVGRGKLELTRAEPGKGVWYDLNFEEGKYVSTGSITMEPTGDSVRVVWSNEGELGRNPVNRYFGLLMDRFMGPDFATGLRNLKGRAEGGTK